MEGPLREVITQKDVVFNAATRSYSVFTAYMNLHLWDIVVDWLAHGEDYDVVMWCLVLVRDGEALDTLQTGNGRPYDRQDQLICNGMLYLRDDSPNAKGQVCAVSDVVMHPGDQLYLAQRSVTACAGTNEVFWQLSYRIAAQ